MKQGWWVAPWLKELTASLLVLRLKRWKKRTDSISCPARTHTLTKNKQKQNKANWKMREKALWRKHLSWQRVQEKWSQFIDREKHVPDEENISGLSNMAQKYSKNRAKFRLARRASCRQVLVWGWLMSVSTEGRICLRAISLWVLGQSARAGAWGCLRRHGASKGWGCVSGSRVFKPQLDLRFHWKVMALSLRFAF